MKKKLLIPLNPEQRMTQDMIKTAKDSWVHFSWLYIYSYIWRHLDIGYVQGMCDLLAPLLVILDDGESTLNHFSALTCVYFYNYWWNRGQVSHSLSHPSFLSLFPPFRGHGLQLFHWAHEENESKLSTRRSYGYSLCQHALSNPGNTVSVKSLHML